MARGAGITEWPLVRGRFPPRTSFPDGRSWHVCSRPPLLSSNTSQVCALAGKTCAIVPAPWQSVWPREYSRFGWPVNTMTYPGEGHQARWFHCVVGTWHTVSRQQSIAFSDPYTDQNVPDAGFVVGAAQAATFAADAAGSTVGILTGSTAAYHFLNNQVCVCVRARVCDQKSSGPCVD